MKSSRHPRRRVLTILAAGVVLGALAFVADFVTGAVGAVMTGLVSSGAAWGAPAAVAGFASAGRRAAVLWPAMMLVIATTVYYLGILVVSRRWDIPGVSLTSGETTSLIGLAGLGRAWIMWLVIGIGIGAVLGLLGYAVRHASALLAGAAAGAATGLLLSEGLSAVLWSLPEYWDLSQPGSSRPLSLLVAMAVAVVAPVVLAVVRAKSIAWWLYALVAVSVGLAGAGAWYVVDMIRNNY